MVGSWKKISKSVARLIILRTKERKKTNKNQPVIWMKKADVQCFPKTPIFFTRDMQKTVVSDGKALHD